MKYTLADISVFLCVLWAGIISFLELLLFIIISLIIAYNHFADVLPSFVWPYLNLQQYNYLTLSASLVTTAVSMFRYGRWHRVKSGADISSEMHTRILNRRKKLLILSVISLLIYMVNSITYAFCPWIYW